MIKYHCIMSFYLLDKPYEVSVANSNMTNDVNVDFWEEWVILKSDSEFDDWMSNHPLCHNVVMVVDKEDR